MNAESSQEQKQSCTQGADLAPRSRRIYSAKEKAEYLALFEDSKMTSTDFCREMGLAEATFSLWRRMAREEASRPEGSSIFAEVQVTEAKSEGAGNAATLTLPSGARLEFTLTNESGWSGLGLLLKALT